MAQTLGPPLWATGSWATDAWADATWSTVVSADTSDDLTTLFAWYVEDLQEASLNPDTNTLVVADFPTVRAAMAAGNLDDVNTMYWVYLR